MDHPGARVGRFGPEATAQIVRRFGFYGVKESGQTYMFQRGLALSPAVQEREGLLNAAVYFTQELAPEDPWNALKRLLRSQSVKPAQDLSAVVAGAGLLVRGAGMMVLDSDATPKALKEFIVNTAIRYNPNLVAEEFQSPGVPHKVMGVSMDAISEQQPNRDSRVMLSERSDRLGVPLAKVDWRIGQEDRRSIARIAELTSKAFPQMGLPEPLLEPWITERRPDDGVIIDSAHILGTTRMSDDPRTGVVDRHCQVHGVNGLYVAGGSVFPTSGHANPTLMILSLAVRLADRLKQRLSVV
jgi:choline dehydrogenase-like flavoprotein